MICIKSHTPKYTLALGKKLAGFFAPGDVVLLNGDLGAGKTLLTRGIIYGLGGIDTRVTSPSYTYLNIYEDLTLLVYHFDVYLLECYEELFELGFEEVLQQQALVIIEWGDKFLQHYHQPVWRVDIVQGEGLEDRFLYIQCPDLKRERALEIWLS